MITIDTQLKDKIDIKVEENLQNNKSKKILLISLITLILLALAVSSQFAYTILKSDKIYKGVYVNDLNASNLTRNELLSQLEEKYQKALSNKNLTLKTNKHSLVINFKDVHVSYDTKKAVYMAYDVGRKGNILQRLAEIFEITNKHRNITIPINFDKEALDKALTIFSEKVKIPVMEAAIFLDSSSPHINSGHHGESINIDKIYSDLEKIFTKADSVALEIPLVITSPKKLNLEELFTEIMTDSVNSTIKTDGKAYEILSHTDGRKIDKNTLASIVEEINSNENITRSLPIEFTPAEITAQTLEASIFKDTLATMSTKFTTNDQNGRSRAVNIRLASSKIEGLILAPGDEFSFNKVVGPRTEKGGYMPAHTYSGGKVVDGVGGGICQVSSTLYNAVLKADLSVTQRKNHYFTVSYVPKGQDATVSYGSVDFRFKNSSKWPIKLHTWMTPDNKIHFSLLGTIDNPEKQVVYFADIIEKINFQTKYINDPTLPVGKTKVKQAGMTGYIVDTYKIVKQAGKEIRREKIQTSKYRALTKEVLRGTKKVPTKPVSSPKPTIKPNTSTKPTTSPKPTPASSPNPGATSKPAVPASPAPTKAPDSTSKPDASDTTEDELTKVEPTDVPAGE